MAVVAGVIFFVVRGALALVPTLALRRPIKKWAALSALAAATFYLFLSGAQVATQRSFYMIAVVLVAFVTVCEIAADVLAAYLVSPLYVTVIDFIPTANVLVAKNAVPLLSVRVPKFVVPDLNVTVPVGVPLLEGSNTVALKVIVCP